VQRRSDIKRVRENLNDGFQSNDETRMYIIAKAEELPQQQLVRKNTI